MLRRLISSLALSATIASPAVAGTYTHISPTMSISNGVPPQLVYAVEKAGVPVIDGSLLDACNKPGYVTYGVYAGKANVIIMCLNSIERKSEYTETFTHEAVHLVQDCRAGLDNTLFDTGNKTYTGRLYNKLRDAYRDNITSVYPVDQWAAEIEAFYFQGNPSIVAAGVSKFCF